MIAFVELGTYVRALLLTVLFVELCISACLTIWSFLQKSFLPKLIAPLAGGIAFVFLFPCAAFIFAQKTGQTATELAYAAAFVGLPAGAVVAVGIALGFVLCGLILFFYHSVNNNISAFSVKESVDKLKTGICFSYKNGMIKLINRKMDELGRIITGSEIQDAHRFMNTLQSGELQPGTERLSSDGNIIIRLPDSSVWSFIINETDTMFEITAADTTDLYRVSEELKTSNDELRRMNERLQQYGENVNELTVARERLETKYRIHAELGNALLATRLFLQHNDGDVNKIINIWQRNITVLGIDNADESEYDAINGLLAAARAVGMTVEIEGEIPEKENVKKLFLSTMAEALTNAVKHADAKTFRACFSSDLFSYTACFSNDGKMPTEPVQEGGGLSAVRKKVQATGGRMSVQAASQFTLTITVPK